MRPVSLRFLAFLATLLIALPSLASTRTHYFCRAMERVLPACCCARKAPTKPPEGSQVRAADCCEEISAAGRTVPATLSAPPTHVPPFALVATVPSFTVAPAPTSKVSTPVPNAQAPPGLGPPLFLKHCSLLT
jgi:hypothetical protein